jgi:hypothetical protein
MLYCETFKLKLFPKSMSEGSVITCGLQDAVILRPLSTPPPSRGGGIGYACDRCPVSGHRRAPPAVPLRAETARAG